MNRSAADDHDVVRWASWSWGRTSCVSVRSTNGACSFTSLACESGESANDGKEHAHETENDADNVVANCSWVDLAIRALEERHEREIICPAEVVSRQYGLGILSPVSILSPPHITDP